MFLNLLLKFVQLMIITLASSGDPLSLMSTLQLAVRID